MPDAASMSVIRISGFVGVSTRMATVLAVIASSMRCGSRVSTKLNSSPKFFATLSKKRYVPPYTFSPQTMWSPALKSIVSDVRQPIPLENANP